MLIGHRFVTRRVHLLLLLATGLTAALLSPSSATAQTGPAAVARAVSVQGTVEAQRVGEAQWQSDTLVTRCSGGA
jgi:hypothetical protein